LVCEEVSVVYVGHDGDERLRVRKRCITLVSLCDEKAPRAEARVAVGTLQASPDDERGILASFGENAGYETGGGGLAMCAGDRYRIAKAHQLAEHLGSRHHGNALLQRRPDLRILACHGARVDDHVGAANVFRAVSDGAARPEPGEPLRDGVVLQVRSLNVVAQVDQHFGDTAHAAAADAHEVDRVDSPHAVETRDAHAALPASLMQVSASSS